MARCVPVVLRASTSPKDAVDPFVLARRGVLFCRGLASLGSTVRGGRPAKALGLNVPDRLLAIAHEVMNKEAGRYFFRD